MARWAGVLGQAQGLPLPDLWGRKGWRGGPAFLGRHKACPYRTFGEERDGEVGRRTWAGTRPAPTGPLGKKGMARWAGVLGQAQGLPLPDLWGRKGWRGGPAYLGRHKACPYRTFGEERDGEVGRRTWAGTRPAPTGPLGKKGMARWAGVLGQAQGLPLPDLWGRKGWRGGPAYLGRHKACPYRTFGEERDGEVGRRTWAGTRPAPTGPLGKKGMARWAGVLGQAQGLPLPDLWGRGGKGKEMCQRGRGRAQGMSLAPKTGPQTKVHHGAIH